MIDDDRCTWCLGYVDGDPAVAGNYFAPLMLPAYTRSAGASSSGDADRGPRSVLRCSPPEFTAIDREGLEQLAQEWSDDAM